MENEMFDVEDLDSQLTINIVQQAEYGTIILNGVNITYNMTKGFS